MGWLRVLCMLLGLLAPSAVAAAANIHLPAPVAEAGGMMASDAKRCGDADQMERCGSACAVPQIALSGSTCLVSLGDSCDFARRPCRTLTGQSGPPEPHPPQS